MPRKASGEPKIKRVRKPQKNGDIYVYEVTELYNPKKRYNEQISSKLLGKIPKGSKDSEIVATRPRKAPAKEPVSASRVNIGVMDILEWIGKASGIDDDIYSCADKGTAQKLISIARFWMANPDKPIRRIEEWQIMHQVPYVNGLSEDVCYNLMQQLGQDITVSQKYFRCRANRAPSRASIAVDSTTYSSYSDLLNDVRYGYNKDGNGLASIKLMTLFSTKDQQPIAFMRQPGNIPDVISVKNAIKQLSVLGMDKPLVVLDGGFFSDENILSFIHDHTKFLMRASVSCRWIRPDLDEVMEDLGIPSNTCPFDSNIYGTTRRITLEFPVIRKRTRNGINAGDVINEDYRIYLHFFRNAEKERQDKAALMDDIQSVKKQLEQGVDSSLLSVAESKIMNKFLSVKERAGKLTVTMKDKAILKAAKYCGYFVLVSNETMDTFEALQEYRLREKTEEGFRIDKQYNDAHTTRSKKSTSLEGRLFCQFIAYGYEEYFQRSINNLKDTLAVPTGDPEIDDSELFKKEKALRDWLNKMSVAKLFDWFDAIQRTTVTTKMAKTRWSTETIERDRLFLQKLGVTMG